MNQSSRRSSRRSRGRSSSRSHHRPRRTTYDDSRPARDERRRQEHKRPFGARALGPVDQSVRSLKIRLRLLLLSMLVSTNLIGVVVVVVVSALVVPVTRATTGTVLVLAIGVPVYVVVAVLLGMFVGLRSTERALRWALQEEEPNETDRRATLRAPFNLTLMQVGLWATATVLFTLLIAMQQPERALGTGLTVGIATVVVGSVAYLLAEFALRPVAARALADDRMSRRQRGMRVGNRMVLFWALGTGVPTLGLMLSALLDLVGVRSGAALGVVVLILGGVVLVFGLLVTVLSARSVVAPVLSVRDALIDVERGDLDRKVPVYDGSELGLLQSGFNRTVSGLRERERLRDLFGRHVGREVALAATSGEGEIGLSAGKARTVSVLFVDLVGSTTYATAHPPEEVVAVLNRFFSVVVHEVDRQGGLVNKFMGDAILAVFGALVDQPEHATAALRAAREMAARLEAEVTEVGAGIGVATGEVVAGNVGAESRFEYTVIGDAVNSAARLTDLAKQVEGRVLVGRTSVDAADPDEAAYWCDDGSRELRGRGVETPVSVLRQVAPGLAAPDPDHRARAASSGCDDAPGDLADQPA